MQLVHDWLVMNSFTIIENCLLVKDITLYTYMYMYMCSDKEKILLQEQKIMWIFFLSLTTLVWYYFWFNFYFTSWEFNTFTFVGEKIPKN